MSVVEESERLVEPVVSCCQEQWVTMTPREWHPPGTITLLTSGKAYTRSPIQCHLKIREQPTHRFDAHKTHFFKLNLHIAQTSGLCYPEPQVHFVFNIVLIYKRKIFATICKFAVLLPRWIHFFFQKPMQLFQCLSNFPSARKTYCIIKIAWKMNFTTQATKFAIQAWPVKKQQSLH